MNRPLRRILLGMVLSMLLVPTAGNASGIGADAPMNQQEQSVNDATSGTIPVLPQVPDIKFHEAGAPPDTAETPANTSPKERVSVVYDPETEKDRGKMITLVIAFGVSLALNIYLATALISARRRV